MKSLGETTDVIDVSSVFTDIFHPQIQFLLTIILNSFVSKAKKTLHSNSLYFKKRVP